MCLYRFSVHSNKEFEAIAPHDCLLPVSIHLKTTSIFQLFDGLDVVESSLWVSC